ncbi:regulator [Rhodoplanes elegans]|uniref:Regulator n=1 Tax=Rhodoplanes elegans TaxID=29408 RepID=A0A327L2J7_9BRAD|nr:H-NS histone family protein [Rhodoplanes elegans]MBK5961285.1 regulator [Rhodoplanes elegans]RAI41918.1 regulator [Rhodoplanes elegans]
MAAINLKSMDVEELLALRGEIDEALAERADDLRKQLARLGQSVGGRPAKGAGRGASALKGVKVPPRYVGPNGETWAGRGARPKWLAALLDEGHSIEEFAVGEAAEEERRVAAAAVPVAKKRGRAVAKKPGRKNG